MTGTETSQAGKDRTRIKNWSEDAAERLKKAVKMAGSQAEIASKAGVSRSVLISIFAGETRPSVGTLEAICAAVGVLPTDIVTGPSARVAEERAPFNHADEIRIPVHDIAVSAGPGVAAIEAGESNEFFTFPGPWLRAKHGDVGQLRIIQVKGDSMAPSLQDGAMLMFHLGRKEPVDGVFVLRIDDQLLVKRLHFQGSKVRISSDNKIYERGDQEIDLAADADAFAIIGRAVWSGMPL